MKFRLVEDRSNEINQAAKNYIANQMKHSNDRQLIDFADKILEKGSVRHHLDSSLGYESLSGARMGRLKPSIVIPADLNSDELTARAIHFIIEHYVGMSWMDFIKLLGSIANAKVVYENNGDIKVCKLPKAVDEYNKHFQKGIK